MLVVQEMEVAKTGKGIEEEGGAVFDVTKFQLDYLTTPSGLLDIGIDLTKVDITTRTRPADELYIIAYPHFNVNGKSAAKCIMSLAQADSPQMHLKAHDIALKHFKQAKYPLHVLCEHRKGRLLFSTYSGRAWWGSALHEPVSASGLCSARLSGWYFFHMILHVHLRTHILPVCLVTLRPES